jgi:hypothetical protein
LKPVQLDWKKEDKYTYQHSSQEKQTYKDLSK